MAWGLPASERRVVAAAAIAGRALGAEPLALALGPAAARAGLREALALGAKRAVLVESELPRLDALVTARALARAAQRLGAQLVFAGSASADAEQGVLGPMLAELLGLEAWQAEKHFRDAVIAEIFEGTNEIQRFIIARDLLGLGG
ncbi:MAG: hypothetical protein LC624_08425, partial [Halobacteriales archaeon]|nr:hypothetical protein [Halobacteriales archaeon]